MELRHLRYFCAVAEESSFTRAGKRLHVSQSGVSGQVRELEHEVGVALLRRGKREVTLTPEGVVFLPEAQELLRRADRAVEMARRASRGEAGRLTVGLCGPATSGFLPGLIRRFRERYPGVVVQVREREPAEQVGAVAEGVLDVGFTRGVPGGMRHLVHGELLFREALVAALPKEHRLAAAAAVSVAELAGEQLLLYAREGAPPVFDAVLAMCRRAKVAPRLGETPASWMALLTMVEAEEGVALVPACVGRLAVQDVVFRPVREARQNLEVLAVRRRGEASVLVESFLGLLRRELALGGG